MLLMNICGSTKSLLKNSIEQLKLIINGLKKKPEKKLKKRNVKQSSKDAEQKIRSVKKR